MFDFDSHQVEKHLAEYAVFQVKLALIELKLNMKAFFNSNLHFNWSISIWFLAYVSNNELFFLGDFIILAIYDNINIVPESDNNPIVCFKLFFYSVELKIVRNIVCQSSWRF